MRQVIWRTRCERDLKRMIRRGKDREEILDVLYLLARDGTLDSLYRPHKLSGEYEGMWECHIEPDWLLIYDVSDDEVLLARTGTHTDLFT